MSRLKWGKISFLWLILSFSPGITEAQQLTAPGADSSELTSYPVFTGNDNIFYFWGNEGHTGASLSAESSGAIVDFTWEKYNESTGTFDLIISESGSVSSRTGLDNGCYRVSFNEAGIDYVFRAWVFNCWINATAIVENSNCESFELKGGAAGAVYTYYDLSSGQPVTLNSEFNYQWYNGSVLLTSLQNTTIYDPPSLDTGYRLEVTDRSGCSGSTEVTYISIVPDAKFSWNTDQESDPMFSNPEAPAEISFSNESVNADIDKYEWHFFKDIDKIRAEGGVEGEGADSIMEVINEENPVYTYERSGKYMVKLIAMKESENYICSDTFYLEDYIVVDTSFVSVSPVFTPNGDGVNDRLVVKTRSLESINFQILNRWGRKVHHFKKSGYLPEDSELVIWDGKIGSKYASAGVYFYVIDAIGRDNGKRIRKKGFVHLIR